MRPRMLLGVLAVALTAALLVRDLGPGASARPTEGRSRIERTPPPLLPEPPSGPLRNVFEYGRDQSLGAPSVAPPRTTAPPVTFAVPDVPTPAPVRLVGLVTRAGRVKAALSVEGELAVLGEGEGSGGYTVLDIDEDAGVRLRRPDGTVVDLPLPVS